MLPRALVAISFAILSVARLATADDALEEWFSETATAPDPIFSESDFFGLEFFRIGDMLFAYGYSSVPENGIRELAKVDSVARTIEKGMPDRSISALIDALLQWPHSFIFEEARLKDYGDMGLVWHLTWTLSPKNAGASGIPFRYTALVLPDGRVIRPDRALHDKYLAGPHELVCSLLSLKLSAPEDVGPDETTIHARATQALNELISKSPKPDLRFRFVDQQRVSLPVVLDEEGNIKTREVWAVNFVSESRESLGPRGPDVFTIWVSESGDVADLKFLSVEGNDQ